jgi:predicted enzyme related to lactoylglutathione lyase
MLEQAGATVAVADALNAKSVEQALDPGLLVYIMVDSVDATIQTALTNGDEIVQPLCADAPEIIARFRDPAGNVIGLYQEPSH